MRILERWVTTTKGKASIRGELWPSDRWNPAPTASHDTMVECLPVQVTNLPVGAHSRSTTL